MSTTGPDKDLIAALEALWAGDLSHRMPESGEAADAAHKHNLFLDRLQQLDSETRRITREVGGGIFGGQAEVHDLKGCWKQQMDNLNVMAEKLTVQFRDIAAITHGVARGDLSRMVTVDAGGEVLELKTMINVMIDSLKVFASEILRLFYEIGTEGRLGGQANISGAAGVWKDLADGLNGMSGQLTDQLRTFSKVTAAIAAGDITKGHLPERR